MPAACRTPPRASGQIATSATTTSVSSTAAWRARGCRSRSPTTRAASSTSTGARPCRAGEALYHGAGGLLECRPQTPERDCYERSLLRRFGAGVFVLTMVREELYEEYREETVVETYSGMSLVLDGGVGGRVY